MAIRAIVRVAAATRAIVRVVTRVDQTIEITTTITEATTEEDLPVVTTRHSNNLRKSMLKQSRIKSGKHRPNSPVVVVKVKTSKPNIAVTNVRKWLRNVQLQKRRAITT
ncbi:hypothetical protein D3C73_1374210 [compost metagenome]